MNWEGLYVRISQEKENLRLLLKIVNRNKLQSMSKLSKDKWTAWYFSVFPNNFTFCIIMELNQVILSSWINLIKLIKIIITNKINIYTNTN